MTNGAADTEAIIYMRIYMYMYLTDFFEFPDASAISESDIVY